jgi:glycosyltransferase involved in cell wall biosynthesis
MINIVTCFWNAEQYIGLCLDSILEQSYKDYRVFIIDDMSTDKTIDIIKQKISDDSRFNLIQNTTKKFKLKNLDDLISDTNLIQDDDIIIEIDGDDWLAKPDALDIVNKTYLNNPNLMIANSKFKFINNREGFSRFVDIASIRYSAFCFSHLRTWKCSLWRSVNKSYFIDPRTSDNTYFKITADMAYSLPMLELAGQDRYAHIEDILLIYNDFNPHNDHKPGSAAGGQFEQGITDRIIRKLQFNNEKY